MITHFPSFRSFVSIPLFMAPTRHFLGACILLLSTLSPASSQTPEQLAQLEPEDLLYNGWNVSRQAEILTKQEQFIDAYAKLRQAKSIYDVMAINHATFKPGIVEMRQKLTRQRMDEIFPKAEAQQQAKQKNSGNFIESVTPSTQPLTPIDPARDRKRVQNLTSLQAQIDQLQKSLANALNDRDANAAKVRKALTDLKTERNRLASAPLRSEVDALNDEIAGLKRERDTMALALSMTRAELGKTQQRLGIARKALEASQKRELELRAVIKEQGRVNSRVARGQQDQIDELRREMKEKDLIITDSNRNLNQLAKQLEQSQQMVTELQDERETLIREKQEMTNLLDLNEAERIQKLLTQNVALNKQYQDAKKELQTVLNVEDAASEKLILAKRGVTLAKAKIREAQKENIQQKLRIRDLENRLKLAEEDITRSAENTDLSEEQREELEMLREIAKSKRDQLKAQQKKAELLIEHAERMGVVDVDWARAVNQFKGSIQPELTSDEEAMIADINLRSRFQPSSKERIRANQELQRRTGDMKKVSSKLFEKKDFEAARGILEMVIEEDPASWDTMVNLGIVNLRLGDPSTATKQFEQAILYAGERKIPIAHFLLGDSYYKSGRFGEAQVEINRSLSMEPENAQAFVLLGNMAGKIGQMMEAEIHFKRAIELEPNMWEPHYNLAYICAEDGRLTQGVIHYQEALRRGAPAHLTLEKKLGL